MQGGLAPGDARAIELHLDACRACGALLAEVARIYVSAAQSSIGLHSVVRPSIPAGGGAPHGASPYLRVVPPPLPEGPSEGALGRYQLSGLLGAGGMGVVFAAHDPLLQRRVALKLVRPDLETGARTDVQGRLVREAQAAARIAHPNVVAVHDVGWVGAHVFFAMELVEGPTLRQWLAQAPRNVGEIVSVMLQAARGLEAIHAAGLVHCDVKPDNIIVGVDGRTRITDLGLAAASWAPGEMAGTPAYMAPERTAGGPPTAVSDQWSFAATFYEALFGARGGSALPDRTAGRSLAVPAWLEAVLRRGLSMDPRWRFASMSEIVATLAAGDRGNGPAHVRSSIVVQGLIWLVDAAFVAFSFVNSALSASAPSSTAGEASSPATLTSFEVIAVLLIIAIVAWLPVTIAWVPVNAYGLWRRRAWARSATLLYGVFAMLSCVGLPFGIYLVYAMTRPSVRAELDR